MASFLAFCTLDYLSIVVHYLSSVGADFAQWTNNCTCVQFDINCESKGDFPLKAFIRDRICPIDGLPCQKDCPDRYIDDPLGGCILTDAIERGYKVYDMGSGDYICVRNLGAIGLRNEVPHAPLA